MKGKVKFILGLLLGIIIGALIAIGVYFLTVGEVAWKEYVENSLIPNVVIALTSIGTICLAAIPIIKKVRNTIESFKSATKDVNDTVANNGKTEKKVVELEERIAGLEECLDGIETSSKNTEQIVRIAFCNTDELVKKGYAKEIAKVGSNEVNNEEIEG